jgi:alkylhydroperoxidase family enzyme
VSLTELDSITRWRSLPGFTPPERAALALMESMVEGAVPDSVNLEVARFFTPGERVELVMTGGLYCMVPRVLDALRVPLESDGARSPEG